MEFGKTGRGRAGFYITDIPQQHHVHDEFLRRSNGSNVLQIQLFFLLVSLTLRSISILKWKTAIQADRHVVVRQHNSIMNNNKFKFTYVRYVRKALLLSVSGTE